MIKLVCQLCRNAYAETSSMAFLYTSVISTREFLKSLYIGHNLNVIFSDTVSLDHRRNVIPQPKE